MRNWKLVLSIISLVVGLLILSVTVPVLVYHWFMR